MSVVKWCCTYLEDQNGQENESVSKKRAQMRRRAERADKRVGTLTNEERVQAYFGSSLRLPVCTMVNIYPVF